ncbi:MAG: VTC domain-containing protein [Verrucomicrobiae bacterium]|nr:VTC domain-containing protein [Verrucomicrobiae bacterium]
MPPLLENPRYERKFLPQGLVLADVLALVRCHPGLFREVYPPRYVNNIYFDTPSRKDYHDHVSGLPNRSKMRVRWYGPAGGRVARPVLEQKIKRGYVGGKLAHGLPDFCLNGKGFRNPVITAFRSAPLPAHVQEKLCQVQPALFNRYRRYYYLSGDGRFRLTVDAELQFGSASGNDGLHRLISKPSVLVVELKFATESADEADRVTNDLRFRLSRCSKYVLGMENLASAAF